MIDAAAYRRLTALGRLLVDEGHLTRQGQQTLGDVLINEYKEPEEDDPA